MALSNWDTMTLNEAGAPTNGVFVSKLDVTVEFYKNWIYVRDEAAWADGGAFVRPTVMQITEGQIVYKDVHISAIRGPQNGIFAVVWTASYNKNKVEIHGMAGCGVYGFAEDCEPASWVGVQPETVRWWIAQLQHQEHHVEEHPVRDQKGTSEPVRFEYDEYTFDCPDEFRGLDWGKGLRFNQGDQYFASRGGLDLSATSPGEAEKPMLLQMLGSEDDSK